MTSKLILFNTPKIEEWALDVLSAPEFAECVEILARHDAYINFGLLTGQITVDKEEQVLHSQVLDADFHAHIGNRYTIADDYFFDFEEQYLDWVTRYEQETGNKQLIVS